MALIPRKRMSSDLLDPKPREGSFNGVTSDGVFKATGEAIDNILDNGSASETIVVAVPSSQSSNYTVGNYYEVQGKVARLRTKTDGDNVTQLTFDTTSGLLDAMNEIIESIVSIGSPLQWKGPATVAELNAGITGIQPGWTYTLTDAGTLTDGSVDVEAGDEVAWTEDSEWFKVGGDSGKVEVFQVAYDSTVEDYVWPTYSDISTVVQKKKSACIVRTNPAGARDIYWLSHNTTASANTYYQFVSGLGNSVKIYSNTVETGNVHYIGSVKNGGPLTDAASIDVPNDALSTLATAQAALTLNVNVGVNEVPNFAVEVTPSADCTLTVTKTVGNSTTTLSPSVAGGDSLTTGKKYQLTCVGSCWTLAEFTVPTP
jgi:hypothetical protein